MAEAGVDITGRCLCGAVRFRSSAAPLAARFCWCRDCQRFAAGNATVNVVFARPSVTIEGETSAYESVADSGMAMRRSFCPECGTPLFSEALSRPQLIIIRAGALDDPDLAEPSAAIWTSSAPRWACIDPELKQFPAQPPPG
ncbi:MAG TPA: GFA family protein [Caulobacteraceae bacterium]|jgi:hypothetical protein